MKPPIRVLIANSNTIFREGLKKILEMEPDIEIVGEASDTLETVSKYLRHLPDITIMDLRLPETECTDAITAIRKENSHARIVILTSYGSEEDIIRGLYLGASGYLLKDSSPEIIIQTIRAVISGEESLSPEIAAKVTKHAASKKLSECERAVLDNMALGKSNSQIAESLTLSESTIKFHVNNILFKLEAANRTEAVVSGLKRGLIRLS